ncbi:phytanoyl-CoA dioxygenase family protein [Pseudoalteromonas xiamenensis]|uniref:Phytanoyl-CoA dioxygenase family protein n=1 Tax=Pseudoalteromonas xiamenensis TaxID=882626 RepID=A0A975HMV8_9GAMM|nr:phytanoyl-CoA dioxygenase family protein [Pseudoalteromonas xiamenensis]QTH73526.1 phytanoyl-CoA dioxygenase family protein [Pseudoalteromonas xiamenensis]
MDLEHAASHYEEYGFVCLRNFLPQTMLDMVEPVVRTFHDRWVEDNHLFYKASAINSSGLTAETYLEKEERQKLFALIGSEEMSKLATTLLKRPIYMNSQLFFNPINPHQKNYWHRDGQYHLSLEEQKDALQGPDIIHVRIPLANEPGMELVPKSHKTWDSPLALDVRLEKNGHKKSDPLPEGQIVQLNRGDVLAFSANMLHRGLYGQERFALDILFCEPEMHSFLNDVHQPCAEIKATLECLAVFP